MPRILECTVWRVSSQPKMGQLRGPEVAFATSLCWRILDVLTLSLWCVTLYYGVLVGSQGCHAAVLVSAALAIRRYLRRTDAVCKCTFTTNDSRLSVLTLYDGGKFTRQEYQAFLPDGHEPHRGAGSWPLWHATPWLTFMVLCVLPVTATLGTSDDSTSSQAMVTACMSAAIAAATSAATLAASVAAAKVTPDSKTTRPKYKNGTYDKSKWSVVDLQDGTYKLKLIGERKEYTVPKSRINSALHLLDPEHLVATIKSGECRCHRDCRSKLSSAQLVDIRLQWNLRYVGMEEVKNANSSRLRAIMDPPKHGEPRQSSDLKYSWREEEMCSAYCAAAVGVGRNTMVVMGQLAVTGDTAKEHAAKGVKKSTTAQKLPTSVRFWDYYLDSFCQGWEGKRFLPSGSTKRNIYDNAVPE
jgi:hypothetical protein